MMKNIVSYSLELKEEYKCFYELINMFRDTVRFLIPIVDYEYSSIKDLEINDQFSFVSTLIKSSKSNGSLNHSIESLLHDYKLSAVNQAVRIVKRYRKPLALWEHSDKSNGKPLLKLIIMQCPIFISRGMFLNL